MSPRLACEISDAVPADAERVRVRAVKLANRYCAGSSQQAVVESFDDVRLGGVIGDPTSSLVFRCGAPNTTALSR